MRSLSLRVVILTVVMIVFSVWVWPVCAEGRMAGPRTALNVDPFFERPVDDYVLHDPECVTEYMVGGRRQVAQVVEHEFVNGRWSVVFESGRAVLSFDHNGSDYAHVHMGAFWGKAGWLPSGKLTRDFDVEVEMKFRILNFTDGPWLRAGVAYAVQVDLAAENPYQPPFSKFFELDFFRGANTSPWFNPSVFLVDFLRAEVGEFYSIRFPLSRYAQELTEDYFGWGVYLAVECIQSQMALEVYEFSVWYWPKESVDYVDLFDVYENMENENAFLRAQKTGVLPYIPMLVALGCVVVTVFVVRKSLRASRQK